MCFQLIKDILDDWQSKFHKVFIFSENENAGCLIVLSAALVLVHILLVPVTQELLAYTKLLPSILQLSEGTDAGKLDKWQINTIQTLTLGKGIKYHK